MQRELQSLPSEIALAEQAVAQQTDRLRKLESIREGREANRYTAKRIAEDVERYAALIDRREAAVAGLRSTDSSIADARDRTSAFRDKQIVVIARISQMFDAIIVELIGQQARGRVNAYRLRRRSR